jgi:hypothetical protein
MAKGYFENENSVIPFDSVKCVDKEMDGGIRIFQYGDAPEVYSVIPGEEAQKFLEGFRAYCDNQIIFGADIANLLDCIARRLSGI